MESLGQDLDEPPDYRWTKIRESQIEGLNWWNSALNIPQPKAHLQYAKDLESLACDLLEDPVFGCTEGEWKILNSLKTRLQSYTFLVSELAKKCQDGKKSPGLNFARLNSLKHRFKYYISEIGSRTNKFYGK